MKKTQKIRGLAGILLIMVAVAGLVLWETKGREFVLMTDVCATVRNIKEGEKLEATMFRTVSVTRDSVVDQVVTPEKISRVNGVAASYIPSGAMMSMAYVRTPEDIAAKNASYFVVAGDWISMCSSAVRRGDRIEIFSNDGLKSFGIFDVGFVKDSENEEVRDIAGGGSGFASGNSDSRADATSKLNHIEIVATLDRYLSIKRFAESASGPALMVVAKDIVR